MRRYPPISGAQTADKIIFIIMNIIQKNTKNNILIILGNSIPAATASTKTTFILAARREGKGAPIPD